MKLTGGLQFEAVSEAPELSPSEQCQPAVPLGSATSESGRISAESAGTSSAAGSKPRPAVVLRSSSTIRAKMSPCLPPDRDQL